MQYCFLFDNVVIIFLCKTLQEFPLNTNIFMRHYIAEYLNSARKLNKNGIKLNKINHSIVKEKIISYLYIACRMNEIVNGRIALLHIVTMLDNDISIILKFNEGYIFVADENDCGD